MSEEKKEEGDEHEEAKYDTGAAREESPNPTSGGGGDDYGGSFSNANSAVNTTTTTKTTTATGTTEATTEPKAANSLDNLPANTNLWEYFLHQTSGQKRQEGHLVVLGNAGSGKTELVSTVGRIEGKFGEMKKFLMMRYSYIYMTDPNSDTSNRVLNVWQISSPSHCGVLSEIIPKEQMNVLGWMIVLDCSQPHNVKEEFDKWMQVVVKTQAALLGRCDSKQQGELKDKIYEHVQYYTNPNDAEAVETTEEIKTDVGLNRTNPKVNIGAPVLVVLNKVDMMKSLYPAEAQANSQYEILTQFVRLWGLDYAAAAFSMGKGLKEQGKRIASYLEHRIFGATFNRGPSAVVSLTNLKDEFLFIPSGFDSQQILESQANTRSLADPFDKYFPLPKNQSKAAKKEFVPQANNDITFLKEMAWALDNAKSKDPSSRVAESTEESTAISSTGTDDKRKRDAEAVQKFFTKLLENSTG